MYNTTKPHNAIILEQVKRTWETKYLTVSDGPYPIITRKFALEVHEVDHTDGIGTKGEYHWRYRTFRNAVLDAMAMNLNDLHMVRATPYKLQNHIIMPEDDGEAVFEISKALADECVSRGIAITGGETSVHDNHAGLEISITMSGFLEEVRPNLFKNGQVLIGLASNGIHSNGFSLIRKACREKGVEFDPTWLAPTRIYRVPDLHLISGIQHITGGAFTKLKSRAEPNSDIFIKSKMEVPEVFQTVYNAFGGDVTDETMYRTFNCGIGMVLGVSPKDVERVLNTAGGEVIGSVEPGFGRIIIESQFSKSRLVL